MASGTSEGARGEGCMRKRKPDLTKRQKEVLAILRSELLRHRYAPTMR